MGTSSVFSFPAVPPRAVSPRRKRRAPAITALLATLAVGLSGCASAGDTAAPAPASAEGVERLTAVVEETLPFNPQSFTQGLEVTEDGMVLVGTGQEGQSRLYRVDPATGREDASVPLDPTFFGEGITQFEDTVWQLTWQDGIAVKHDATTLAETGRANYAGEGWGLCSLDNELILSDGTAQLRRMDPDSFAEKGRIDVTYEDKPLDKLNELECVDGQVFANVWFSTDIVRIDPATGKVTAVIDASGLPNNAGEDPNNVLNGIAHIPGTDEFYVTGKRWPDLYRVRFAPSAPAA